MLRMEGDLLRTTALAPGSRRDGRGPGDRLYCPGARLVVVRRNGRACARWFDRYTVLEFSSADSLGEGIYVPGAVLVDKSRCRLISRAL